MSRTDPQFNLRIPAELKEKIEAAAKHGKRSATAEIISRLEWSFLGDDHLEMMSQPYEFEVTEPGLAAQLAHIHDYVKRADAMIKAAMKFHYEKTGESTSLVDDNGEAYLAHEDPKTAP